VRMTRLLWLVFVLVEITVALILGWPGVANVIRILIFSKPKDFFGPDSHYFMRMLADDLIRMASAAILVAHAAWIVRRRISELSH
jgi:hypothetical protein